MNANGNFFTKALQKARILTPFGVSILAPAALVVGLLHNVDKTKPKEQKSFGEKTADFIKNHAGLLTAASYIPMVGEEGLASIRGIKQAKKFLPKESVSKLKGNYLKAWGTYAGLALLVSAGVTAGVWISDVIKKHAASKNQPKEL